MWLKWWYIVFTVMSWLGILWVELFFISLKTNSMETSFFCSERHINCQPNGHSNTISSRNSESIKDIDIKLKHIYVHTCDSQSITINAAFIVYHSYNIPSYVYNIKIEYICFDYYSLWTSCNYSNIAILFNVC